MVPRRVNDCIFGSKRDAVARPNFIKYSVTYHAIYNTLIQSDYQYVGAFLPIATYVPVLLVVYGKQLTRKVNYETGAK